MCGQGTPRAIPESEEEVLSEGNEDVKGPRVITTELCCNRRALRTDGV